MFSSPQRLNEKSPERRAAEKEDEEMFHTFSKSFKDQSYKKRVLLKFLAKTIAIENELETLREQLALNR